MSRNITKDAHLDTMGTEKIGKLLLKFSIPTVVSLIITAIYSTVDMAIIGRYYGAKATLPVAAISLSYPIYGVMSAVSVLVGVGSNTLIAIHLGKKESENAEKILGQTIILLFIAGIFFSTIGQLVLKSVTILCGASKGTLPYAMQYNRVYLYGSLSVFFAFGLPQLIRAEGNIIFSTATSAIASVMNMVGDYILVYIFKLGVAGASLSTILSLTVQSTVVLVYYLGGFSCVKIRIKNLKVDIQTILKIIKMGIGPALIEIADSFMLIIFNISLLYYGKDIALSAMGIAKLIFRLAFLPVLGLQQCIQPLVGYNYGAKKLDRVKQLINKSLMLTIIIGIIGTIIIEVFPKELIFIFGKDDTELIKQGTHVLRIISLMLPFLGVQLILAGYFQATARTKIATFLNISRQCIFLIPIIIILPICMGLDGIYWAIPISDALGIIITIIVSKKYLKLL